MDRFKFRGKSCVTGKMIYGSLVVDSDGVHGIIKEPSCGLGMCYDEDLGNLIYPIEEGTEGQCTGRKDGSNDLIFAGDILQDDDISGQPTSRYVVSWDDHSACFKLNNVKQTCCNYYFAGDVRMKIIGNIHDNPELLEQS